VRRPFPTRQLRELDPFLLLDEMGPVEWGPGEALGAPDHPHRGFETVTYLLAGRMQHRDSQGHAGLLGPGDVQWMTAGAGVVHSELPEPDFKQQGGVMHGVQLWVNLPARDKMMEPRYQDIPAARIPAAVSDDGLVRVRVIAGEALARAAVIDTRIPIQYLHYTLQPGGSVEQAVPAPHNAMVYVLSGLVHLGDAATPVRSGELAHLGAGEVLHMCVPVTATTAADLLLLSAAPLHEPVARHGPFVMNTQAEIEQAIKDYQAGRMGRITL
jgi:redox-sensitive bicupin YhaK (pirin superfamily)